MLPGSAHPDGGSYEWEHRNGSPALELPATVLAKHVVKLGIWKGETKDGKLATAGPLPDTIFEGEGRDNAMTSLAGTMNRRAMLSTTILAALHAENKARCKPPLSPTDLERIVRSIMQESPC